MTRILCASDFHCGHDHGLTPPEYWYSEDRDAETALWQQDLWNWYVKQITQTPPDVVLVTGDAIDGRGFLSGGVEQITTDLRLQAKMASEALRLCNTNRISVIRGSGYHVGRDTNIEDFIADGLGVSVTDSEYYSLEGTILHARHKISRSGIPHGRFTPSAKAAMWNQIAANRNQALKADILIRGHVHYFTRIEDEHSIALTCPAMCGKTRYGNQECDGLTTTGLLWIELEQSKPPVIRCDVFPGSKILPVPALI
jgi:hypothetical protein